MFPAASSPGPRESKRKGKRLANSVSKASLDGSDGPAKPAYSYAGLIGQAILSHPQRRISLADIYGFIMSRYPYYRKEDSGWQNSIRHNLSLNDCFVKTARTDQDEPGKGMLWTIADGTDECFEGGNFRKPTKAGKSNKRLAVAVSSKGKSKDEPESEPAEVTPRPTTNKRSATQLYSEDDSESEDLEAEIERSVAKKPRLEPEPTLHHPSRPQSRSELDEKIRKERTTHPRSPSPEPDSPGRYEHERPSSPPNAPPSSDAPLTSPLRSATSRARAREVFNPTPLPRPALPSPIVVSSPPSNVFARLAQPYHAFPTSLKAVNEALMSSPPVSGILPADPFSYHRGGGGGSPRAGGCLQPAFLPMNKGLATGGGGGGGGGGKHELTFHPPGLMSPSSLVNVHTQSPISSVRGTNKPSNNNTAARDERGETESNDENEDTTTKDSADAPPSAAAPARPHPAGRAVSPVLKTPTRGLPHPRSPVKPLMGGTCSASASSSRALQAVLAATPKRAGGGGGGNSGYFFGTPGANPSPGPLIDSYDFEEGTSSGAGGVARQLWFQSPGSGRSW
jgi:hypothetical protein